jgi:hypothetical protein
MIESTLTALVIHSTGAIALIATSMSDALVSSQRKRAVSLPWVAVESRQLVAESVYAVQDAASEPWFARAA